MRAGPVGLVAAPAGGGRRATPALKYLKAKTEALDKNDRSCKELSPILQMIGRAEIVDRPCLTRVLAALSMVAIAGLLSLAFATPASAQGVVIDAGASDSLGDVSGGPSDRWRYTLGLGAVAVPY